MTTISFTGRYSVTTSYRVGDFVTYGGKLYRAILPSVAISPQNPSHWTLSSNGFPWKNNWSSNTTYQIGDSVRYANTAFLSLANTNLGNQPNTSINFWKVFNNDYKDIVTNQPGDIQYQGNILPQRLPIGNSNTLLTITTTGVPNWLKLTDTIPQGNINQFLSLAANGEVYWRNAVVTRNLGDLQYQGANGVYISLPVGANGTVLTANANSYLFWSDVTTPINININTLSNTVNSISSNLARFSSNTTNSISSLGYSQTYNSANGLQFYANNNISFYQDSVITVANTVYNANGFITSFTERMNPQILGGGITYTYNITYFANNIINDITRI